jgi:UrcA family protein
MIKNAVRVALAMATTGLLIASGPAAAQTTEIVVEAPRVTHTGQASPAGAKVDIISVTHRVSYRDIDISTHSGAKVLEQRVADSAKAACAEIEKLYPLATPADTSGSCQKDAVAKAMVQVNAAVAAAEKAARK